MFLFFKKYLFVFCAVFCCLSFFLADLNDYSYLCEVNFSDHYSVCVRVPIGSSIWVVKQKVGALIHERAETIDLMFFDNCLVNEDIFPSSLAKIYILQGRIRPYVASNVASEDSIERPFSVAPLESYSF